MQDAFQPTTDPYTVTVGAIQSHPPFQPIPGLISYTRVTGRWGLLSHTRNAVRWLILFERSVEAAPNSSKVQSSYVVVLRKSLLWAIITVICCQCTNVHVNMCMLIHCTHVPEYQEHIRMAVRVRACKLCRIWNQVEFTASAKNSNMYCAAVHRHKPLLLSMWPGVLFSIILPKLRASVVVTYSYPSRPLDI